MNCVRSCWAHESVAVRSFEEIHRNNTEIIMVLNKGTEAMYRMFDRIFLISFFFFSALDLDFCIPDFECGSGLWDSSVYRILSKG